MDMLFYYQYFVPNGKKQISDIVKFFQRIKRKLIQEYFDKIQNYRINLTLQTFNFLGFEIIFNP